MGLSIWYSKVLHKKLTSSFSVNCKFLTSKNTLTPRSAWLPDLFQATHIYFVYICSGKGSGGGKQMMCDMFHLFHPPPSPITDHTHTHSPLTHSPLPHRSLTLFTPSPLYHHTHPPHTHHTTHNPLSTLHWPKSTGLNRQGGGGGGGSLFNLMSSKNSWKPERRLLLLKDANFNWRELSFFVWIFSLVSYAKCSVSRNTKHTKLSFAC